MNNTTKTRNRLVDLDPRELAQHPTNVRHAIGDIRSLVRSVRAKGVVQPITVVPVDGGHQIVCGHRRCAAAIEAELATVPCVIRADLAGQDVDQLASQLVENRERVDLTTGEQAAGFEQLTALGLSDTAIMGATGATRTEVKAAHQIAGSEAATELAHRLQLPFKEAALVAEFDGDPDAVATLTKTARDNPAQLAHVASRLRQDAEREAQRQATVDQLTAAGVRVLTLDESYGATWVARLRTAEGAAITPEDHAGCPGHAAAIKEWTPTQPTYYCTDPTANGHQVEGSDRARGKMTDDQKAERRVVVANNKAWQAAQPVRDEFISGLLARRTAPKGTLRYLATRIVTDPAAIGRGGQGFVCAFLGVEPLDTDAMHAALAQLPDARVPLVLLAQVADDAEDALASRTWRFPWAEDGQWLAFLASCGYALSDIEQGVIDALAPKKAGRRKAA